MYFDSHCHLDMEPLKTEIPAVVERAFKAGVKGMINVGSSIRGSKASIELANLYPNIWATVGLHPHDAETLGDLDFVIEELLVLANNEKVVAIGEIGLDYFNPDNRDQRPEAWIRKRQKELFEAQLQLAQELKLPVVLHTRDADEDMLKILKKYKGLKGVVHCFSGNKEFAEKLLDLGYCIGFTGFVTFEQDKFDQIREAAKVVPIEKMLIETDAPFLAPEPFRGKTNEPAYVPEVAKKIAALKAVPLEEIAQKTLQNTEKLFSLT